MIWTDEDGFLLKPLGIIININSILQFFMNDKQYEVLSIFRPLQTAACNLSLFSLSSDPGKLMTKYYLKFDTMKHIMQTPVNCTIEDALHIICCAEEIACMYICNDYVSSGT